MNLIGEFLILAERVVHDSFTGLVSALQCVEEIQSSAFPAQHPGFAVFARYRLEGEPPTAPRPVAFRLVRSTEVDGESVVVEYPGEWAPETTRARIATNFTVLQLHRPERVWFRVDHRLDGGPWVPGPTCPIDIVAAPPSTP